MPTPREERRKRPRGANSLYLRFVNHRTGETIGDLEDISMEGFRLECLKPVKLGTEITFHVDVPLEITPRGFITMTARSLWTGTDRMDGRLQDVGFVIISLDPNDRRALELIIQRYGSRMHGG